MELTSSQTGIDVLPELSRRLNIVLLRNLKGQKFEFLVEPPEWFEMVFRRSRQTKEIDLESASLFLDSFQTDAEEHWAKKRPEPLKSGVWHEFDDNDSEHYLEATALYVNDIPVLSIESLGHDYEVRVQLFQKARNFVLQNLTLDFETQKNDILLHFLTSDLSPPLQRLTEMLEDVSANVSKDSVTRDKLEEASAMCSRQNKFVGSFLQGFSAEVVAMQHISRDLASAPDVVEAARTLVKGELDHFLSRSVGLSLESVVSPGERYQVVGHQPRLEKLLSSLMHFALRRAPQSSTISLRVSAPDQDWVQVDLFESVASLREDEVDIFDNLLSSDNLVRKSALALYFCKITVERWGGEIGYSLAGERGCWWFRLRRVRRAN